MQLPRTSRRSEHTLREVVLGRGDYAAGGARSIPFLDLDGARRRRPLVFGEVVDDLSGYPPLAASMFSGRQTDPAEWAVMWKELGADGVFFRPMHPGSDTDAAVSTAATISDRTRLPVVVSADSEPGFEVEFLKKVADTVTDSVLILRTCSAGTYRALYGDVGDHILTLPCENASDASAARGDGTVLELKGGALGNGLRSTVDLAGTIRAGALEGDDSMSHPTMWDATCAWDCPWPCVEDDQFIGSRNVSMWEAASATAVMMSGADVVLARGPGAADMIRVYGEELADL